MKNTFYAHGKLLLTAEYFVLDGAKALALPTKQGQGLEVQSLPLLHGAISTLQWTSWDEIKKTWFEGIFDLKTLHCLGYSDESTATRLEEILKTARQLNPTFLNDFQISWQCGTFLEFPRTWGLGTSSTLISMLATWAQVNPYLLLEQTFGGSGYDLACAIADSPILYQNRQATQTLFQPSFLENLYFVYLGKKQNSREGIARYRANVKTQPNLIDEISALTIAIQNAPSLRVFDELLLEHETIVARSLDLSRAKTLYFKDFWGEIKSLGAWGGDFVLATSQRNSLETIHYFKTKGLNCFEAKGFLV
jgi:mevalonate kinase